MLHGCDEELWSGRVEKNLLDLTLGLAEWFLKSRGKVETNSGIKTTCDLHADILWI